MSKTYNGNDKIDKFFAHYGRKGMKRGENIFNPNYKPIGEKAKGPSSQAEAQQRAFTASQKYAVDSRRQKLLNAEKARYSFAAKTNQKVTNGENQKDKYEENQKLAIAQKEYTKAFFADMLEGVKATGSYSEEAYEQHKAMWDSMSPSVRGYNIRLMKEIVFAKGGMEMSDEILSNFGSDNSVWALSSSSLAIAAGRDGYDDIIAHAAAIARESGNADRVYAVKKARETRNKTTELENRIRNNRQYLAELEYNSKKNNW